MHVGMSVQSGCYGRRGERVIVATMRCRGHRYYRTLPESTGRKERTTQLPSQGQNEKQT